MGGMTRHQHRAEPERTDGFSLIEVMVAMLVLSIALLSLVGVFTMSLQRMRASTPMLVCRIRWKLSMSRPAATTSNIASAASRPTMTPRADGRRNVIALSEIPRAPDLIPEDTSTRNARNAGGSATRSAVNSASPTPKEISATPNAGESNGARLP